jgi:hypothetical protein
MLGNGAIKEMSAPVDIVTLYDIEYMSHMRNLRHLLSLWQVVATCKG